MELEDKILKEITKIALDKSFKFLSKLFNKEETNSSFTQNKLERGLSIHINKAFRFSENISILRYPDSYDVTENSIKLCLARQDRRFSSLGSRKIIEEADLLNDDFHHLLLGDPGAGKTTTLKRLTKKVFNTLSSEETDSYKYSFPIVVRLGEIEQTESFFTHICGQLGIEYETHKKIINYTEEKTIYYTEEKIVVKEIEDPDTKEIQKIYKRVEVPKSKKVETLGTKIIYEYKIGEYPLKYSLSEYLNEIECIIFIDGLDEVHFKIKNSVFEEIKELSQILNSSKIILTSRYIQEISSFKQFQICEILPLREDQKREIADIWINNTELFFSKIRFMPYNDLTDRPLFLFYLLRLFDSNNEMLPIQAVDVYRQIVLLSIREWDDDKELEIRRYSKYRDFDTYKKEDFLSELSFVLTYSQRVKKLFTHRQLESAYLEIYSRYPNLSSKDEKDIVKDIEAHNGLIIEIYNNKFEFSHLSLQEYLCAKYILSIPISRKFYELLNIYAAPFAIATVLSSKPEEYFAVLFLLNIDEIRIIYQIDSDTIYEYLDRLLIEKIHFSVPTVELGFAVLYLFFKYSETMASLKLIKFSNTKYIYESVRKALHFYNIEEYGDQYYFEMKEKLITDLHIRCPEKGSVKTKYIKKLVH